MVAALKNEPADAMYKACVMPEKERKKRMKRMRTQVQKHTVFDGGAKIFEELDGIRPVKGVA